MELSRQAVADFQEMVWRHYDEHSRDLLWRHPEPKGNFDPYKIMVSEIMLQQTQVSRVTPKFQEFVALFPDISSLASASLAQVLQAWSGLGYNRRAKFLWQAAQMVMTEFGGKMPETVEALQKLPGIGRNTAGAIVAYAHDRPVVFIETNIRAVYIHYFFPNRDDVSDKEILELVEQTLPREEGKEQPETSAWPKPGAMRKTVGLSHCREWYWALMDLGSHLKATVGNISRSSKHYAKQSVFHGSKRQIRGQVIRLLTEQPYSLLELQDQIKDDRLSGVLDDLLLEGMVQLTGQRYSL